MHQHLSNSRYLSATRFAWVLASLLVALDVASVAAQTGRSGQPFGAPLEPMPRPKPIVPPAEFSIQEWQDRNRSAASPPTEAEWEKLCATSKGTNAPARAKSGNTHASNAEPALIGRVVDASTKVEIEGAVVFGFYHPIARTVANGKTQTWSKPCSLRSFEAITDAQGRFTISEWSGDHASVTPEHRSILVAVFKAGYETTGPSIDGSLRNWTEKPAPMNSAKSQLVDISQSPIQLTRIQPYDTRAKHVEDRHWQSLNRATIGLGFEGECGWQAYPSTLVAMHNEQKRLISLALRPDLIGPDGYAKPTANSMIEERYLGKSVVDQIKAARSKAKETWACANPSHVFRGAK